MIRPLAEAAGAIPALAALMQVEWPNWYGPGGMGDAGDDLRARARREGLPWGVVALEEGPVGGAALGTSSHGALRGESPWIVGLLVAPGWRGRGIGAALVAACERRARDEGFAEVHATTGAARALLARRGWELRRELPDGQAVMVLSLS